MNREQNQPNPAGRQPPAERRDTDDADLRRKLGRERPGEGLDTGVDTGAIQPGKTDGAHFQD